MKARSGESPDEILRMLPSVDELVRSVTGQRLASSIGAERLASRARGVIDSLREGLRDGGNGPLSRNALLEEAENRLDKTARLDSRRRQTRVINATGVIIHTNLGRAPLSDRAVQAVAETAAGYCTIECDLETGRRGRRGRYAEELLCELTGAESAVIVNNCAAAAFFVLTVFASGSEVPISRGELVEIGGDFRVPDVLTQSGATLREVGTTNRTKLADYERVITSETKLILRVHPSNYRIVGFTAAPSLKDLAALAHGRGLLLYEDAGSGALFDLCGLGIAGEPVVRESSSAGADIVTFSGDKLLGGPQCGLIVGRKDLIELLRKHPLYRALRVDKMTYAALEATLDAYIRGRAVEEIPVITALATTEAKLAERVENFIVRARVAINSQRHLVIEKTSGASAVGGGSAPAVELKSPLIAVSSNTFSADKIGSLLRRNDPPVIARIIKNRIVLDLRTVRESDEEMLLKAISAITSSLD